MSFKLQTIDLTVGNDAEIVIKRQPKPVDGFPLSEERVPIQFPPKITDDTKTSNWMEKDLKTFEPRAIFQGSSARKVSVAFTYIVAGNRVADTTFDAATIANITKQFKGYFYRSIKDNNPIPTVDMHLYNHIGVGLATFRLSDVNITHGETLIRDNSGIFPMLTQIKIGAWLVTQIKGQQKIPGLPEIPLNTWY